ncbi:MAG: bifunctional precorrin-2 dehydrogenase/sirohydrochlorin ferrochelatase [Acutalibacteraceae bacterium]
MTLFPFFEDIDGKRFVVIGGGKVAEGKIRRLLPFTNHITVISENTDIDFVPVIRRAFRESDILSGDYIIAATDSEATNTRIFELCKKYRKPVNTADDPEKCTFIFPSLIKRGELVIGISTTGKSPALSKKLRQQFESELDGDIEKVLDKMGLLRLRLKELIPDQKTRSEILKRALDRYLADADDDLSVEKMIAEYTE